MKIRVGFKAGLGMGEQQVIEASEGEPIYIDGLNLVLSYREGVLEIRSGTRGHPTIRPVSGNVLEVRHGDPSDWKAQQ